jgi:hypothetical protein
MFENRLNAFTPNIGAPFFTPRVFPPAGDRKSAASAPMAVQITDVYQAAAQRAIEDHEIDKLFNPGFDDFQI